jgi:hypothetical protein
MNRFFTYMLAACGLSMAVQASAQVTFYEQPGFRGQSVIVDRPVAALDPYGVAARAASAVVTREAWELCDGPGFTGRCVVLQPGRHDTRVIMNNITSVRPASALGPAYSSPPPAPPSAPPSDRPSTGRITLYEHSEFRGRQVTIDRHAQRLEGFKNAASSAVVVGGSWELCDRRDFGGRCVVLRPGRYPSLGSMGMNDNVSSVRPVR